MCQLPILSRDARPLGELDEKTKTFLLKQEGLIRPEVFEEDEWFIATAVLLAAFYLRGPWEDAQMGEWIAKMPVRLKPNRRRLLLKQLA
jgi:hypothetical protein